MSEQTVSSIASLTLDERTMLGRSPEIEQDRAQALADLLRESRFEISGLPAPYALRLKAVEQRLQIGIEAADGAAKSLTVPLSPLRSLIKDYFLVCESYAEAVRDGNLVKLEAIDMGRRGLHNEGAEILTDLLDGKAVLDTETARRLFTLICVLHIK